MAIAAWLIAVRADGMLAALRIDVAAHAHARRAGREAVAVLADGAARIRVQRRAHGGVAARAHVGGGLLEAALAVTSGARDLAHVRGVAGARGDVAIFRGYLLRHVMVRAA